VVALLPAGASSTPARASRAPLRVPGRPQFAELFGEVAAQRAAAASS
jgi:hypothetical protein